MDEDVVVVKRGPKRDGQAGAGTKKPRCVQDTRCRKGFANAASDSSQIRRPRADLLSPSNGSDRLDYVSISIVYSTPSIIGASITSSKIVW
jgi:hypothetical protein